MFVSVRDRPQGRRRRSQNFGVNKLARSSKLSLLSAITTGSHGSNDSSSTITQESYSKATSRSSKRSSSSKLEGLKEGRTRKSSLGQSNPARSPSQKSHPKEKIDVFTFLVKDEEDTPKVIAEEALCNDKTGTIKDESDTESIVRSLHSDSGISMGESIIQYGNDSLVETHLPPLLEDAQEHQEASGVHLDDHDSPQRTRWKWPEIPIATHKHHLPPYTVRTPSLEHVRTRIPPTPDEYERSMKPTTASMSGYELVADRLASGELPIVFRSFKKVKFRLLLQLQDEILEMEDQLAAVDSADSQARLNCDGSTSPASRRLSWQWSQTDLPAHRLHTLGRLSMKLEQYCESKTW